MNIIIVKYMILNLMVHPKMKMKPKKQMKRSLKYLLLLFEERKFSSLDELIL